MKESSSKKKILIVFLVVLLLAGAGAGVGIGIWLYQKNNKASSKPSKAPSSTPTPSSTAPNGTYAVAAKAIDWDREDADAQLLTLDVVDQFVARAEKVGAPMGVEIKNRDTFLSSNSILMYIRDMEKNDLKDVLRDFAKGVKLSDIRLDKLKQALQDLKVMFSKDGINAWGKLRAKRHTPTDSILPKGIKAPAVRQLDDLLKELKQQGYDVMSTADDGEEEATATNTTGKYATDKEADVDVKNPTKPDMDTGSDVLLDKGTKTVADVQKKVTGSSSGDSDVAGEADVEEEMKEEAGDQLDEEDSAGKGTSTTKDASTNTKMPTDPKGLTKSTTTGTKDETDPSTKDPTNPNGLTKSTTTGTKDETDPSTKDPTNPNGMTTHTPSSDTKQPTDPNSQDKTRPNVVSEGATTTKTDDSFKGDDEFVDTDSGTATSDKETKTDATVAPTRVGGDKPTSLGATDSPGDTDPFPVQKTGRRKVLGRKVMQSAQKKFNRACFKIVIHVFQYKNGTRPFPKAGRYATAAKSLVSKVNWIFQNTEYAMTDGRSKNAAQIVPRIQFTLAELRDDSKKYPYLLLKDYQMWATCGSSGNEEPLSDIYQNNKMDPAQAIHVFVCSWTEGNTGYAWVPGGWDGHNEATPRYQHVYLNTLALSAQDWNNPASFDLGGYLLAHELGHHLGLYHPHDGGCDVDTDGVPDTPLSLTIQEQFWFWDLNTRCETWRKEKKALNWAQMRKEFDSCPKDNGMDPIFNIMSYTGNACYSHFTVGQVLRMRAYTLLYRPKLYKASQGKCPTAT